MVFDLVSYRVGRCVLSDGVDIVTFRPELTTPQHPLDLWVLFENSSCRDALDGLNNVSRRCCGGALYEKVHVVSISANFEEVDVVSLLYSKTDLLERSGNTVGEYFPSVLDGAYDVIQEKRLVVAFLDVFFHATNIHLTSLPS